MLVLYSFVIQGETNVHLCIYLECRDNDETAKEEKAPVKEKHAKPKAIPSLGNKNRFHPYSKEKNAGSAEKKAINRNRVFISNIPYDMKWQAIKDLMREKGNLFLIMHSM